LGVGLGLGACSSDGGGGDASTGGTVDGASTDAATGGSGDDATVDTGGGTETSDATGESTGGNTTGGDTTDATDTTGGDATGTTGGETGDTTGGTGDSTGDDTGATGDTGDTGHGGSWITGGGYSFGECLGACQWDLSIAADTGVVVLTVTGWDSDEPYAVNSGTLTDQGLAMAEDIAVGLVGVVLEETYGCPDCADGGASWVALNRDGVLSTHNYEFDEAPAVLDGADGFVQGLIDDLLDCKAVSEMTPDVGCVGFD
jgi:hypothetical protein